MSFSYFKKLNYTLANEDTSLEFLVAPEKMQHVVCVAGSGSRALPLFAKMPARMTLVDLSQEQLWLAELRIAAVRSFDREKFLAFFGYPGGQGGPEERKQAFSELDLSVGARQFFTGLFEALQWESLLYLGKWEKTFRTISRVVNGIVGERAHGVCEARTLQEQREYIMNDFPEMRWKMALFALGNSSLFNTLLYRGHFPTINLARSHYRYYEESFNRLFARVLARECYFLQIILFGEVRYPEANPIECQAGIYEKVQEGARRADVAYERVNLVDWLAAKPRAVDFLSFSDVPSYFSDHLAQEFMQRIAVSMKPAALTVTRSYLHRPEGVICDGYRDVSAEHAAAIDGERTQMYLVDIHQRL